MSHHPPNYFLFSPTQEGGEYRQTVLKGSIEHEEEAQRYERKKSFMNTKMWVVDNV